MSKIEVNEIDAQSGSTITVGSACKSVAVPGNVVKTNAVQASDAGNIISQSGTTITLGASGDTIQLASGASQSGFGRTGTVDWQTGSIKTATFTAVSGEGYFCNTAGGTFTMNLPAGSAGAIVSVQDYNNTFDSNALTVDANGSEKINGGDGGEPIELNTEGRGVTFVYIDSTVGWRSVQDNDFTKKGTAAAFVTASGGTVTTVCTNFKVHTFTGPGTFTVSCAGNACGSNTVDYLVIAGGGGTATGRGGGGGAGGYRSSNGTASGCYSAGPSPLGASALPVSAQGYPITVGAGGGPSNTTSQPTPGNSGANSIFSTITSTGGGGGGGGPSPTAQGQNGGSGGGGGSIENPNPGSGNNGTGNTPPVSPPQGNDGAPSGPGPTSGGSVGAGGGGASAAGTSNSNPTTAGNGGDGLASSITGSPVTRGGGGGGGGQPGGGNGGAGGGGTGAGNPGQNPGCRSVSGTVNTGGGGGGGADTPSTSPVCTGASGGSGVVIIRYKFQ